MGNLRNKAWGVGLSRTGTSTLCAAFRILGYTRVAHNPAFEQLACLDAATDHSCALYYKYLDYKFPDSKFVLTTRDLDSWLESMRFIFERFPVTRDMDVAIKRRMLIYESVTFNREAFVVAYHRHHSEVRRYFEKRPQDLLEMSITDGAGWGVLCDFLEVPVPDLPFPYRNSRTELIETESSRGSCGPWKRLGSYFTRS